MEPVFLCGGLGVLGLLILLAILGALAGAVLLLVKLGVIAYHATQPEERGTSTEYSLAQQQEAGSRPKENKDD